MGDTFILRSQPIQKGCSGDGRVVLKWKKGSRFFDCKKQLFLGMMVGKIENLTFLETRKM